MSHSISNEEVFFQLIVEEELEDVLSVEKTSHAYPWSMGIFKDCLRAGYYCPVLKINNEIIVYAVMSIAAEEAHIFNICVSSNCRRKGFGWKMMEHLLEVAKDRKTKSIFLEVRPTNEVAIQLYDKIGFLEVGVRKDYYPAKKGREDALIFAKDIFLD